jgi:hypothetical protein
MNVAAAQIVHWQREWRGNDPVRHRSRYPRQPPPLLNPITPTSNIPANRRGLSSLFYLRAFSTRMSPTPCL